MKRGGQNPSSFGAVLQRLRRTAGLSQQELAERAGLSLRGIADLERGARRNPYPATVRRLMQALDLNEADRTSLLIGAAVHESVTDPTQVVSAGTLPRPLSSFIGRERAKTTLQHLLESARLVTLTGSGGIGKTRLAIEVAADRIPVVFVDLAPVSDGELVATAVAEAAGIRKQPSVPPEMLLTRWLASRSLLLVLDNCEHLLQSCAQLVEVLLRTCPGLQILATSRERVGVPGEISWRVPSLAIPEAIASMDHVLESEAVRLFVERAIAVSSGFSLTRQNAASVARLVRRLDGIPLAIELAAARVNVLSVEQIAQRLDRAVRLLVGGSRLAPARQQTLRATFEWSYGLLSESEQRLLARLSVFSGGWTLAAAEVCVARMLISLRFPPHRSTVRTSWICWRNSSTSRSCWPRPVARTSFATECWSLCGSLPPSVSSSLVPPPYSRSAMRVGSPSWLPGQLRSTTVRPRRLPWSVSSAGMPIYKRRSTGYSINQHAGILRCVLPTTWGGSGQRAITGPRQVVDWNSCSAGSRPTLGKRQSSTCSGWRARSNGCAATLRERVDWLVNAYWLRDSTIKLVCSRAPWASPLNWRPREATTRQPANSQRKACR
jgi:transcriptional regulator with XRE-family HTH domain